MEGLGEEEGVEDDDGDNDVLSELLPVDVVVVVGVPRAERLILGDEIVRDCVGSDDTVVVIVQLADGEFQGLYE